MTVTANEKSKCLWSVWKAGLAGWLVAVPLCVFCLFRHDVWRPAEAREAAIAREMIEGGDWTATHLNGDIFLEKPPFYTWALAAPMKVFGYKDWAVRIPVLLFTLGTLALMIPLAGRRLGPWGTAASIPILASMALFIEVNHGAMIDNGMLFFITLAMLAFDRMDAAAGEGETPPRRAAFNGWAVLFWGACGFAFLCKGAIGVLLIGSGAGLYVLVRRRWRLLFSWHWLVGAAMMAAVVGPWLWTLWKQGGAEAYRIFFVKNHLERFLGSEGPTAPWHYYIPQIFAACAPWTLLVPAGIATVVRRARAGDTAARRDGTFWLCWAVGMFVLLSISSGKDNQYILPILPPVALACATWIQRYAEGAGTEDPPRWGRVCFGIIAVFWSLAAMAAPWVPAFTMKEWSLALDTGGFIVGAGFTAALLQKTVEGDRRGLLLALAGVLVWCGFGLNWLEGPLNQSKSSLPLAEMLHANLPEGAELVGWGLNENSEGALIFYGFKPGRAYGNPVDLVERARNGENLALLVCAGRDAKSFPEWMHGNPDWKPIRVKRINKRFYALLRPVVSATMPAENEPDVQSERKP